MDEKNRQDPEIAEGDILSDTDEISAVDPSEVQETETEIVESAPVDEHEAQRAELIAAAESQNSPERETIIPENLQEEMDSLDGQIRELMKKYKLTMWLLVASIVLYLVFLFVVRQSWSTWVVLAICIVMIILAVFNTKYSRRIQKLALERAKLKKAMEVPSPSADGAEDGTIGSSDDDEPIVANAKSLNDLPKQYTVLDTVEFQDGQTADHIVVSPYGVALVGDPALKPEIEAVCQEVADDVPVFVYSPSEDIAQLAEEIQMEKTIVLDERQIMDLLFKLTGLKG